MKKHPKSVSFLILLWLWSYTKLVSAAALGPFSEDVQGYDFESLLYAAATGLLGAAGRTIYALASDRVIVGSLWRQTLKDMVIASLGGMVAFGFVTFCAPFAPSILTREARMLIIVAVGASGGRWVNWTGDLVDAWVARWMTKARGGAAPVEPPPPSAIVPLEDPK